MQQYWDKKNPQEKSYFYQLQAINYSHSINSDSSGND